MTIRRSNWKLLLFTLLCISTAVAAYAEENTVEQEMLFFPLVHLEVRPDISNDSEHGNLVETELEYGSDIVYSGSYKKYRLLSEFYASIDEFELERLQLGIDLKPNLQLWLGRFHSPFDYWNSQYHHGVHLQSSVHRPGIVEYEDHGGVLTNHTTGIKIDGSTPYGDGVFNYSLALGTAPIVKEHKLHTWSGGNDFSKHKLHSIFRLVFQPDELSQTQYGAFGSYTDLNAEQDDLQKISQVTVGAFTFQDFNPVSLIFSGIYVDSQVNESRRTNSSGFFASYIHVEYELSHNWLMYGRIERTIGGTEDLYLEYLDDPELERNLAGIRFDFTRRQAISIEVSKRVNDHDGHTHISTQWSAVFP